LYTQTEDGKKATFLTGYHIFGSEKPDMAKLKAMGINHLTLEVSLGQCQENPGTVFIVPYGFMGPWEMDGSLYLICPEDTIVADGRGAVRLVSKGPDIAISTDVPLKANKTYEVGVSVLAGSNGYLQIGTEKVNFSASNDWQTIQTTITSHADQARGIAVRTSGATDGIYVDNLYVKEVGTQENLVVNGDFERGKIIRSQYGDFCFTVDTGWLETIRAWATEAGSYGMTCCVSLTPHYMPGHVETISYGVSDTGYNHNGFMIYNPTDDVYNELLRAMYDAAAEILGDCEAVSQFMLANEPSFTASESPYYLPKWQGFLREKYGTVGAVNDAWNTAYTSFEHIFMPEEVSLTPLYQDYREFNDGLLTQAFAWQAAYLKEKTPHIETVVKTLQSNNYINKQFKNANDYENWAEFFDINGCDTMAYYNEDENSLSIRGMWLDYISSIKNAPIVDLEMHSLRSGVFTHTDAIIPPWVETTLWHGAMHGVYLTVPWLLDNGTWADFSNTILVNRPECLKVIGEMNYDLNRLAKEIGILQSKKAEIAMYYSRENRDALADNPKIMGKVYDIVVKNGEKVDFVTESNPQALNSGQYQLLVMADIKVLSAEMLEEIKRFTEQGGQVVLVYSELSKNELLSLDTDGKAQNAQTLKKVKDVATILQDSYVSSSLKEKIFVATDKNVRLVDANGNDITDCEWSYTTYGMEYLVSITNHNPDNSVTAYLEIDGERVSDFTELRTLTDYEDSITLSSYQPVLLRTNFVKDTLEVTVSGQTVGATASVVPTDKLDKAMLILALYKDNALIDVKLEYVDATKSECTTRIEKELLEQGNYRVTRFFFDQELNPLLEKEERRFKIQ